MENKTSYVGISGSNKGISFSRSGLKLSFSNIDEKKNIIPMEKAKAKEYVKSKKNKYGDVDRNITAKYSFIIEKVTSPIDNLENCSRGLNCYGLDKVKFIGKIM